jgi:Ni/Fe-hydrogenase subunit HybB-like protein
MNNKKKFLIKRISNVKLLPVQVLVREIKGIVKVIKVHESAIPVAVVVVVTIGIVTVAILLVILHIRLLKLKT